MFIIAGLYRRRSLIVPKSSRTRPTANRLREALFDICQHKIENARFLDLFAGSGAIGLEALSRGACFTTFIEMNKNALQCIESNIANLKVENQIKILGGEVFNMLELLEKKGERFDLIYADPPYKTLIPATPFLYSVEIIKWIDTHSLLNQNGLLFIEESFHSQPRMENLKTLSLKNSRRFGDTGLQQYEKVFVEC